MLRNAILYIIGVSIIVCKTRMFPFSSNCTVFTKVIPGIYGTVSFISISNTLVAITIFVETEVLTIDFNPFISVNTSGIIIRAIIIFRSSRRMEPLTRNQFTIFFKFKCYVTIIICLNRCASSSIKIIPLIAYSKPASYKTSTRQITILTVYFNKSCFFIN